MRSDRLDAATEQNPYHLILYRSALLVYCNIVAGPVIGTRPGHTLATPVNNNLFHIESFKIT